MEQLPEPAKFNCVAAYAVVACSIFVLVIVLGFQTGAT
jgi:hypothetical protein